jgi:peptidoglycan/xylan/chitin deacetylase (PgdA/CDA1 family)
MIRASECAKSRFARFIHTSRLFATLCIAACCGTKASAQSFERENGGVIRGPKTAKAMALVFTGHEFAEGGETILAELARHGAKSSFFLTGDFLTNTDHRELVQRIVREGHYLGPHSDKHVLYCSWEVSRSTLITREQFRNDLECNLKKIEAFGVKEKDIRFFLPPYEHYNEVIVHWTQEMGLTLINYTPGTRSNADYTGENEKNFVSSEAILQSIIKQEQRDPSGLNGFILLLHIGSGPSRKDKFHLLFGELMNRLAATHKFVRVDELLKQSETTNGH